MEPKKESSNDFAGREIAETRLLNAPIELVWEVWSKPEHIKNWWGPNGFTNTITKMEFKSGGVWELVMHGPDGTDYPNQSRFKEVVKHERIVYEHVSKPSFVTTVTFTPQGKKTLLNWHMLFASKEEFEWVVKNHKADKGLEQNIEKMEAYLAAHQPQDFHCSISVNVSAKEALEKTGNVKDWWAKNFKGSAHNLNNVFTVTFGKTFVTFKISEALPEKKIVWQVTDCYLDWLNDKTEWNGTKVVWEISANNNVTQIDMTHVGLVPGAECYNDCEKGWNGHIKGSLFNLITKGKGNPE
jgi:uncharacterized protein YndB with AHSA1/START domain